MGGKSQGRGKRGRASFTKRKLPRSQHPSSDRAFEARNRALHAVARMRRDGLSIRAAAKEEGTTPETIRKYLPAAIRRSKAGKWIVTKADSYARWVKLPGAHGPVSTEARGSEEAQLASHYLSSVGRWSRTGKVYELTPFEGKKIGNFELITSPRVLRALFDAGLLQLDSLYAALRDVS